MKKYLLYLVIIASCFFSTSAYAYLDPGTSGIIIQAILGFITASVAAISFYWNKVKLFFSKIFKKEKKDQKE